MLPIEKITFLGRDEELWEQCEVSWRYVIYGVKMHTWQPFVLGPELAWGSVNGI